MYSFSNKMYLTVIKQIYVWVTRWYYIICSKYFSNTYLITINKVEVSPCWMWSTRNLKMLCMYLYTLIIGHKFCNTLSMLNKFTLQKKLQNVVTNNALLDKKVKTQQQNKKLNIKTLAWAGNWTRDLSYQKRMRNLCTNELTESNDCSQSK